jgi:hypothetical protein
MDGAFLWIQWLGCDSRLLAEACWSSKHPNV